MILLNTFCAASLVGCSAGWGYRLLFVATVLKAYDALAHLVVPTPRSKRGAVPKRSGGTHPWYLLSDYMLSATAHRHAKSPDSVAAPGPSEHKWTYSVNSDNTQTISREKKSSVPSKSTEAEPSEEALVQVSPVHSATVRGDAERSESEHDIPQEAAGSSSSHSLTLSASAAVTAAETNEKEEDEAQASKRYSSVGEEV